MTLSAVLERLGPHLAQIKVLHRVFCTGVAEAPQATPNVVRASHLLNTLYKAILEYDSVGEASEQEVSFIHLSVPSFPTYFLPSFLPSLLTSFLPLRGCVVGGGCAVGGGCVVEIGRAHV